MLNPIFGVVPTLKSVVLERDVENTVNARMRFDVLRDAEGTVQSVTRALAIWRTFLPDSINTI